MSIADTGSELLRFNVAANDVSRVQKWRAFNGLERPRQGL